MEPRRSIVSLVLVPAVASNLVTLLRLGLELVGLPPGTTPAEPTWWVSLSLLIPLAGLYFGYLVKEDAQPYRRLALALLAYGYAVRIPTAIVYGLSGALGWNTHYSQWGPPGSDVGYFGGALFPQLVVWPILTLAVGMLLGSIVVLAGRRKRDASPA